MTLVKLLKPPVKPSRGRPVKPGVQIITIDQRFETQSRRVVERFGGVPRLVHALKEAGCPKNPSTIYRWLYSKDHKGSNGLIPISAWPDIFKAAANEGIILSSEDIDPRIKFMQSIAGEKKLGKDNYTGEQKKNPLDVED